MATAVPKALILGHSFIRRLKSDLENKTQARFCANFHLNGTANVSLFGVGGRTVSKLLQFDLHVVRDCNPDIVILEIGTNDLSKEGPELVGSQIDDLVMLLIRDYSVRVIGVCLVIPRGIAYPDAAVFAQQADLLNIYLRTVLEQYKNVFCWEHKQLNSPFKDLYLSDGVHVNPAGQYFLYRSYRGAILKALSLL